MRRSCGVLLHPTSLPGDLGVGDLGADARAFVGKLAEAGVGWWQMLPLNVPGHGGSPYSAESAFASNPSLIDVTDLVERGLLAPGALSAAMDEVDWAEEEAAVDFGASTARKDALLRAAHEAFERDAGALERAGYEEFCAERAEWLEPHALFAALKRARGGSWGDWGEALTRREPGALERARAEHADELAYHRFCQWVFHEQWGALRAHALERGVRMIGDLPIFVAMDSADVWARRELFMLDEAGAASVVAGVPPDYFSPTGQKWGNPLYDWEAMAARGYAWWLDRVRTAREAVDVMRIDHFRGFESYWEVPAAAPTAETGQWVKGPGDGFFDAIRDALGEVPFIAEDLGLITDEVHALRDRHELPGMKVMHFAFDGSPDHPFLPHTYPERCVAYLGTHDNDTTAGWYASLTDDERHRVRVYLGASDDEVLPAMLERLLESDAELAVVTPQDLLGLGSEARMNTPATVEGNWSWRMTREQLYDDATWAFLADMTEHTGRRA